MIPEIFKRHGLFFLISIFFIQNSFCQLYSSDTIFLKRGNISNSFHRVFVLNNFSTYHTQLFQNMQKDSVHIAEVNAILNAGLSNKKVPMLSNLLLGEWMSLHSYKGKLYAYSPSEPYINSYMNLTDSSIEINDFSDGIIPMRITEIAKTKNYGIVFIVKGLYEYTRQVTFYFLNKEMDLALVETTNQAKEKRYEIMATKNKIFHMPIIVNDCLTSRVGEWQFDKINYRKILNSREIFK